MKGLVGGPLLVGEPGARAPCPLPPPLNSALLLGHTHSRRRDRDTKGVEGKEEGRSVSLPADYGSGERRKLPSGLWAHFGENCA